MAIVWPVSVKKSFSEKVEASRILHSNHIARTVPTRSICHSFSTGVRLPFDLPVISCNAVFQGARLLDGSSVLLYRPNKTYVEML